MENKQQLRLWLDTETTGLDAQKHAVIQIGGVIETIQGEILETFELHTRPFEQDEITQQALDVNGFTREQIATFPNPRQTHRDFTKLLQKYVNPTNPSEKFIIAGQNIFFDVDFMKNWFKKCKDDYFFSYFFTPFLDVPSVLLHLMPEIRASYKRFSMDVLVEMLEVDRSEFGEKHTALTDAMTARAVYMKLLELQKELVKG